jgi:hypothetical protein
MIASQLDRLNCRKLHHFAAATCTTSLPQAAPLLRASHFSALSSRTPSGVRDLHFNTPSDHGSPLHRSWSYNDLRLVLPNVYSRENSLRSFPYASDLILEFVEVATQFGRGASSIGILQFHFGTHPLFA